MSLLAEILREAGRDPSRPAIVQPDRTLSMADVLDLSLDIAGGLRAAGLQIGDRVAVHVGNRWELASVYLACLRIGAVVAPVSGRLSSAEVAYILADSGARFYIGERATHTPHGSVVSQSELDGVWLIDDPASGTWHASSTDSVHPTAFPDVVDSRLAIIFYTSGTTGQPKGVACSHGSLDAATALVADAETDVDGLRYPLMDLINPWMILTFLSCIRRGLPFGLTSTHTVPSIIEMLRTHRCGWIAGVPTTFTAMIEFVDEQPDQRIDLRHTTCVTGGDACPSALSRRFAAVFGAHLGSIYGQTETGGPVLYQPRVDTTDQPTLGWPLGSVDIRIAADGEGTSGELLIRTPGRPVGLWKSGRIDHFDPEGWMRTADIVHVDPNGCVVFEGREKDVIKNAGYPVSPLEVERALMSHPGVSGAVVFGVPDELNGERVVAMISSARHHSLTDEQLMSSLVGRIAPYKHPTEIIRTDAIPVLKNGKAGRGRLALEYASGRLTPARATP